MTLKRDRDNIARIRDGDVECWSQWSRDEWRLVNNGYTHITFWLDTKRERRTDYTGRKKFRVVTTHKVTFEFRLAYGTNIVLDDEYTFSGGEGKTIRRIIELYRDGWFEREAKWQAQKMATAGGVTDRALFQAGYDFDFYGDQRKTDTKVAMNYLKLAQQVKGERGCDSK